MFSVVFRNKNHPENNFMLAGFEPTPYDLDQQAVIKELKILNV